MKHFTKFFENRPETFRGHNFKQNPLSMTLPDVVPTLKDIILSGSPQLVGGQPMYDSSFEEGEQRALIQSAPLEMVLAGMEQQQTAEDDKRSEKDDDGGGSSSQGQDHSGDAGAGQGATQQGAAEQGAAE